MSKDRPMTGDTFTCNLCGMAVELTADCKCKMGPDCTPVFECCMQPMTYLPAACDPPTKSN